MGKKTWIERGKYCKQCTGGNNLSSTIGYYSDEEEGRGQDFVEKVKKGLSFRLQGRGEK